MSEETEFPEGALAKFLNYPIVVTPRMGETEQALPFVHVSDLLKNKADNRFCIREFVLRHHDKPTRSKGTVPPKMGLLWDTGNLIGDHVVIKKLLAKSSDLAPKIWGDWQCDGCNVVVNRFSYRPTACSCGSKNLTYKEVDLRETDVRLVGHPDLLARLEDGTIIIYEIKTIDRTDIDFEGINRPLGDHHMQASYYYYLLKKLGHKVSKRIRFLYIDRDIQNMYREKPFIELVEDVLPVSRIQTGIDTCKSAKSHIEKRTLPDRICESATCTRAAKCTTLASCFARRLNFIPDPISLASMSPSQAQGSTSKDSGKRTTSTTMSPPQRKAAPTRNGLTSSRRRSSKT